MKIFQLLLFVLLSSTGFELLAATRAFRLGDVLSAEISRNNVAIKNFDKKDYPFSFNHYAYALVAVKLHKGRSLSIHDFSLKFKNKTYKCFALSSGNDSFDAKNWQLTKTDPKTVYALLFILDSDIFGSAKKNIPLTLVYNLSKTGQVNCQLPFKFINYDKLTSVRKIPTKGIFSRVQIDTNKKVSRRSGQK
jgi:hypothetical protein